MNRFLTPELRRLLCNALIEPHFDYACSAWYPNLTQKLSLKLKKASNYANQMYSILSSIGSIVHISHEKFKDLNWLQVNTTLEQFIDGKCSYLHLKMISVFGIIS